MNHNVKTITLDDVGRVSINVRWTASMLDKDKGHGVVADFRQRRLNPGDSERDDVVGFAKAETSQASRSLITFLKSARRNMYPLQRSDGP